MVHPLGDACYASGLSWGVRFVLEILIPQWSDGRRGGR